MRNFPDVLSEEEKKTFAIMIDGYNELRHRQLWPIMSSADIMEWENYKRVLINKITKSIKENKV